MIYLGTARKKNTKMDNFEKTEENGQTPETKQNPMKRGIFDTAPLLYAVTLILILFGQTLGVLLEFIPFMTGSDVLVTATLYFEFIGIWVLVVLYMRFGNMGGNLLMSGRSDSDRTSVV